MMMAMFIVEVIFAVYIVNTNRHANTKIGWLVAILCLPIVGCLLFVIFGVLPFNQKTWVSYNADQAKFIKYENYEYSQTVKKRNDDSATLFSYSLNCFLRPIYLNNDMQLITSNAQFYQECISSIRSAKKFIHIETYIIHDGFFLRTIFCELIKKAQNGVKVRFLYDWYGSYRKFPYSMIKELKSNGVEVGVFNPKGFNMFKGATNYRLHRKAIIIDNETAIYGGSNIGDEYLNISKKTGHWKDYNFIIKGEIVNTINLGFCTDWIGFTGSTVSTEQKLAFQNQIADILSIVKNEQKIEMQFTSSSPNYQEKGVNDTIFSLFSKAKKSIKIITPYFLPTDTVISTLQSAAWSGIKVDIILPGQNDDKDFILAMNRFSYNKLLNTHINVHEFDGFIHAKIIIVDETFVFITSANLDFRSLWINFENGILINNEVFANNLQKIFNQTLLQCNKVDQKFVNQFKLFRYNILYCALNFFRPMF